MMMMTMSMIMIVMMMMTIRYGDVGDDDGDFINKKIQAWARYCLVVWYNHCLGQYLS